MVFGPPALYCVPSVIFVRRLFFLFFSCTPRRLVLTLPACPAALNLRLGCCRASSLSICCVLGCRFTRFFFCPKIDDRLLLLCLRHGRRHGHGQATVMSYRIKISAIDVRVSNGSQILFGVCMHANRAVPNIVLSTSKHMLSSSAYHPNNARTPTHDFCKE